MAVLVSMLAVCGCGEDTNRSDAIMPKDGVFVIDARGIRSGEVKFFHYDTGAKTVVFLVAKTKGGEIKTAFDACVTCYPYKKGYVCKDGRVVCIQCGTAFELGELGIGKGNCIPIKIDHRLESGRVLIDRKVIEAGARWF